MTNTTSRYLIHVPDHTRVWSHFPPLENHIEDLLNMHRNGGIHEPQVPQRLTVEASRPQSTALESYPQSVRDLTRTEVKMLTQILHLDNAASIVSQHGPQIRQLLQALPKRLRRRRPRPSGWIKPSTGLCDLHRTLNSEVIADVLSLVQREVTTHFRQFDAYPQLVQPVEADLLAGLRALKGMWTKPTVHGPVAPRALAYQINGCPACTLARIASDGEIVRNLRVVLQSRTRTRKTHRAPTLMVFVDECIRQFGGDDADELFGTASNFAYQMKATRKACVRAWYHDPTRQHSDRSRRQRRHHKKPSLSPKGHHRQTRTLPLDEIPEENTSTASIHHAERKRRSIAPSPDLRRSDRHNALERPSKPAPLITHPSPVHHVPQRKVHDSARPVYTWGDVEKELSMVRSYRGLAQGNPYSQGTPIQEAKVAPLRVSNSARAGTSREGSVEVPLKYQYSTSDYSSSDYWTDVSCEDSECQVSGPKTPSSAMTTWSMVCGEGKCF